MQKVRSIANLFYCPYTIISAYIRLYTVIYAQLKSMLFFFRYFPVVKKKINKIFILMLKNIPWNITIPVIVGAGLIGIAMWFVTKPGGLLNKFDGDEDED